MAEMGDPSLNLMSLPSSSRSSPAANAPIIMADPATDASHARPNANIIANMVGVPGRSTRLNHRTKGGTMRSANN